jgi:hypothetical protein
MTRLISILGWLQDLFNAPPLASMTHRQKLGRVCLITCSLVLLCILSAMILAVIIFLAQRTHQAVSSLLALDFRQALVIGGILILSACVNALCLLVLLYVRRLDRRLMSSPPAPPTLR